MNTEILIYILIFLGVALFNYLGPRIAQWLKEQQLAHASQQQTQSPVQFKEVSSAVAATYPPLRNAKLPLHESTIASVTAAPRSRSTVRSHLANRNNLRQAMVMMTVLGPCRAAEQDSNRHAPIRDAHKPD